MNFLTRSIQIKVHIEYANTWSHIVNTLSYSSVFTNTLYTKANVLKIWLPQADWRANNVMPTYDINIRFNHLVGVQKIIKIDSECDIYFYFIAPFR